MRVFSKRFSVIAGFGTLVLVLIAGVLLTRRQMAVQLKDYSWIAHTRQVLFNLEATESLLKDAETGQRGFLLTGEERYLEPYNAAVAKLPPNFDTLAGLVADNPRQVQELAKLRSLSSEKLSELQQTVQLYRKGHQEEARRVVLSDRGKIVMDQVRDVVSGMRSEEQRLERMRTDRYERSVRLTVASLYLVGSLGVSGLCVLAFFILRAISLRDQYTMEVRSQEERFRVTLTCIGDGVIAADRDGNVTFLNTVAEKLTGRTLEQAAGRPIQQVFPIFSEITGAPAENPVERVIAEDRTVGLANHTVLEHSDGHRTPIEDGAAPIHDDQKRLIGVVLVFRDATADRQSQELLRRTEKLAAAARLSATVAHEINNPLEAVTNLVYLSKVAPGVPCEVVEQLAVAENELARVAHITRQTLGFYRESRERQPVDLAAILDSVLDLYSNKLHGKHIHVQRKYEPCAKALGAPGELRQVLANLVSNAADAVGKFGTIILSIRPLEGGGDCAIEVTIEDDGPGVPAENLSRIFEPFFTTKKDVGTGLGLYVTREILERHGGTISVVSPTNNGAGGSRFILHLAGLAAESQSEPQLSAPDFIA